MEPVTLRNAPACARSFRCVMALRLDYESVEIDKRFAVVIFGPGNPHHERLLRCDQFGVARWRFPFAHDLRAEAFQVKELPKRGYGILVSTVPVFSEVISFEKLFESTNPFQ